MTARVPVFAAVLLLLSAPARAQEVTREPDGTVSLHASNASLGRLVYALAQISPFEKIILADDVDTRLVTVTVERVTARDALLRVLESASVNYVLSANRLIVGDAVFAGPANTGAPATKAARAIASADDALPVEGDDLRRQKDAMDQPDAADSGFPEVRPPDTETQIRNQELERALARPPVAIPPGGVIDLPFPGPDGRTPIGVVKPLHPPAQALPFPITPGAQPLKATPLPLDPRQIELIKVLSPGGTPGK